jgi:hypothetical protein
MTEALLGRLTGQPVRQACDPDGDVPQCCFKVDSVSPDAADSE